MIMITSFFVAVVFGGAIFLHALRYQPFSIDPAIYLLVAALVALGVMVYKILIYPFAVSPLRHLPTPKGHWLLGQTVRQFRANSPHGAAVDWMLEFPEADLIRPLMLGNSESILVCSPRALKEVTQTHCYSFVKPKFLARTAEGIIGKGGICFAEGEVHRQQRRCFNVPFLVKNVKNSMPAMLAKGEQLANAIGETAAGNDDIVEVSSLIIKATIDIISKAVMGYEVDSLADASKSEFYLRTMDVMHLSTTDQIMLALDNFFPARKWIPIEANRRFLHAGNIISELLTDHVRKCISKIRQEPDAEKDFDSNHTDIFTMIVRELIEKGDPLSEELLVCQLRTLMVGGHESTANSIAWCLHMLAIHPSVQTRLRAAIREVITEDSFTYEAVNSIDYLDCVIKEVTRLYPSFVSMLRTPIHDIEICGTLIPAGTLLTMYPAVTQYNPTIWGPTVNEFNPDRWHALPSAAHDPYVYQVFYSGTRVCVGRAFGLLEIKTFLTKLLLKWEFHPIDKEPEMPWSGFTLKPTHGLKLRITPAPEP
ncbi:hypothetical protein TESG_06279 [Trichophyton tonsurans CBS 112818]|uniref:Cytochrome P450 n=2 Tax=Trichophyton TaxID=5550 RepID=F2S5R8_TRIT1|nr:hypothetical protein TESG_06279 [Trichophyton tonsurans CBS 112818]